MLIDQHQRKVDYLRLAVTDRCNLRCNYCMPEEGINFASREEVLELDELFRLSEILVEAGIRKIRITGGEPFVRKDLLTLLQRIVRIPDLDEVSITTNATLIGDYLDDLKSIGIKRINVSLDALDRETFLRVTRRDQFDTVYRNLLRMIALGFEVRINCIALENQNIDQLVPLVGLGKDYPVSVRILEEMPFNGGSHAFNSITWNHQAILDLIAAAYPNFEPLQSEASSTSRNYRIAGFRGSFGIIPSFSRTFCGTCNRLRVSATGDVMNCLYAKPSHNLREAIRGKDPANEVLRIVHQSLQAKAINGKEAERISQDLFPASMTAIGG